MTLTRAAAAVPAHLPAPPRPAPPLAVLNSQRVLLNSPKMLPAIYRARQPGAVYQRCHCCLRCWHKTNKTVDRRTKVNKVQGCHIQKTKKKERKTQLNRKKTQRKSKSKYIRERDREKSREEMVSASAGSHWRIISIVEGTSVAAFPLWVSSCRSTSNGNNGANNNTYNPLRARLRLHTQC